MLQEELIGLAEELICLKTEKQNIEVLAAQDACPGRLYPALSAFSNRDEGGILLFGLDPQQAFAPVGVRDPLELQKRIAEQCSQMQPPVRALFTQAEYRGVTLCSAEIPAVDLPERPCYYAGAGRTRGAYTRVGFQNLPMTEYELYCCEARRKHLHADDRPIARAEYALLDADLVDRYLRSMRAARPGLEQIPEEQLNELLSITRSGIPTLAAILHFGRYPQGYLPQLAILAAVVQEEPAGAAVPQAARRIEGTLSQMLEKAVAFVLEHGRREADSDLQTGEGTAWGEYPASALRTAVLYALLHRDYSIYTEGMPIRLLLYPDRLELHSPGGPCSCRYAGETGSESLEVRNPVLTAMTEVLLHPAAGAAGRSAPGPELEAAGLPAPGFEERREETVLTLYSRESAAAAACCPGSRSPEAAAETEEEIVLTFCRTPRSRKEIAEHMGLSTVFYAVQKYIQPLLREGKLELTLPEKPRSSKQRFIAVRNS